MDVSGSAGPSALGGALPRNLVIRPARSTYDAAQLGPSEFKVGDVAVVHRPPPLRAA